MMEFYFCDTLSCVHCAFSTYSKEEYSIFNLLVKEFTVAVVQIHSLSNIIQISFFQGSW